MGVVLELDDLANTFRSAYGFETETWLIPTVKSLFALTTKALQTVQGFGDPDNLLIVYYGGHGLINDARQGVWTCKSDLNQGSLPWHAIQPHFEQADCDVLLLLDCCAAASGAPTNSESASVTETIAACGFETWAPRPGRHSFTNTLIAVLEDWKGRTAFTAAMLHCEILQRLRHERPERYRNTDKFEYRKSPIHVLSTNDRHARSIELSPREIPSHGPNDVIASNIPSARGSSVSKCAGDAELDSNGPPVGALISEDANLTHQTGELYDMDSLANILDNGDTALPHVLITLALEEEPDSTLDLEQWKRWFQQFPALAKHVKVQGVYKGNSTFMILSVPVVVWDWIPEDPACVFIGYVYSDNLLAQTASAPTAADRYVESMGNKMFNEIKKKLEMLPEERVHPEVCFENSCYPYSKHRRLSDASTLTEVKKKVEMLCEKREHPEVCFVKGWYPDFSWPRNLHYDEASMDSHSMLGDDRDDLNILLSTGFGNPASSCEVEILEGFCRGTTLEDIALGIGLAGGLRTVWLDDRGSSPDLNGSGDARQYENPLTATGLYRALKQSRFHHKNTPDAARRLIYINDLNPACIRALAATASGYQTAVLRNAIYKHLTFQTSIGVKIPRDGVLTFQLDLHLPFFILRISTPPDISVEKVYTKPQRAWSDLSFLKLDLPISEGQDPEEVWGIQESHISCVITGSDNWQWVAYGFVDAEVDGLLCDSSETDLRFDRIAACELDVNFPIWRPREYFLQVFAIRIEQVRGQWEHLVYKLGLGINRCMKEHRSTLPRSSGNARERASEIREAFDWTLKTMSLLRMLDGVLSGTIDAWKSFCSPDNDIGYFQDTDATARRSFHSIQAIFRQLQDHQRRMVVLNESCSNFSETLKLRLNLESKEAADYDRVTSIFTVSIFYPVALSVGIFSMQQAAIPFDLNPSSFVLTVFLLMATIYAIRLVTRHAAHFRWPELARRVGLWITTVKLREKGDELPGNYFRGVFPSRTGIYPNGIMGGEDRNDLKPYATRALLGPQVTEWEAWADD